MRANIRLSLFKLFPVQLLALLDNVIAKLTGNTAFPDLPIAMAALIALRDELKAAIEKATGGGVLDRKLRDQKVLEAREALRSIADYCRSVSKGDAVMLASAGFPMAKLPEPINSVGVPGNVMANNTSFSGEVLLRWSKTTGSRLFRVEQADGDPAQGTVTWRTISLIGRHRFVVKGLAPYTPVWFRVVAIGIESEGFPSDVVIARAA